MNTSHDPRAAVDEARNRYRNVTAQLGVLGLDTAIPEGVRAIAETAVAQTRDVYNRSQNALDESIAMFERTFDTAGNEATAFNRKIIALARRNVDSAFDLAESLASAKDLAEVVELQRAYWQKQFSILSAQALEVSTLSNEVAAAAAESVKVHVAKSADHLRKAS
jgi:phasin